MSKKNLLWKQLNKQNSSSDYNYNEQLAPGKPNHGKGKIDSLLR